MREDIKLGFLLIVLVAMVAFCAGYLMQERDDCHARGGALVRGMIWVECVAGVL